MKFSNGAWLMGKGVTPHPARRVTEYAIEKDTLTLWCVDRAGSEGADSFHGTVLRIEITSPMEDVLRVRMVHHQPQQRGITKFDLDYSMKSSAQSSQSQSSQSRSPGVKIDDQKEQVVFTSGRLGVRIGKAPFEMTFLDGQDVITSAGPDAPAYMEVAQGESAGGHMVQRLMLGVGECIYGLGERFGPVVKNGQNVVMWNEDGGTVCDQAYKNIPFYLSSRGYGLLVNSPGRVDFEIATERVSAVQFSTPQKELDFYLFYGPGPKAVLEKYTRLAGRPAMPPAWSFGLWLSTSFTTHYDETTVTQFIDGMAQRGIPLSVFHFDCFWMKQRHWCDFLWDSRAFPDPAGMLKRLKAKGLKICVWINSYISSMSRLFGEGREKGYFLKRPDGSVYQIDDWQPGMALVDFTNPGACMWYQSHLRKLLEMGVDCFKTDFGERIPADALYFDGSDPKLAHNYYPYLYNKCVFELLEDFHSKGRAIVFARSATAGSQKFPVHWGGDCLATFESMAEDFRGGLSFCLSGPAFWSHDIGGFSGKANPSLYKRWVAFGLLSSHSRLHGSESYRVPWMFDEESVNVMRHFVKLKNRLFPYLFATAAEAHEQGYPMMRHMLLEFPDDPACLYQDRQYMLGSSLLVSPVFRQDGVAEYYLPRGKWTHLLSGKVVSGGQWRRERFDFFSLPLFVRENTILAMSRNDASPAWKLADPLELHLFQVADGADLSARFVPSDGRGAGRVRCARSGDKLTLSLEGKAAAVTVVLRGMAKISRINNGKRATVGGNIAVQWTDISRPLVITQ